MALTFRNSFSVFTKHNPPTDPDKQSHQGRIYLQFQEDGQAQAFLEGVRSGVDLWDHLVDLAQEDGQAQAFLEGVGQESTYRITS
ncbi:hypothetical protein PGT21_006254 [Puccinia graminis f. sp. tritici]|uniref:Uncharacterized protein n=1 Tax=Puccinia graminis f. sp. tritici TaxID=56615 RepID=A0A5B0P9U6_PUCGR|nr:hypothetical protein PGT21_006254 [Puccinia graminis f. sp. tritici]